MLRASHSAQDGGYERLQEYAEDDDQDESQCIFHNHELISFPFVPDLPAPGMRVFFCFGKAQPEDEGKPETENTLPPGGRLSVSPESRSGLTHRRTGLDSQERIHANTRGRTNGRAASGQKKNLAAGQRFQNKTDVLRFSLST
jgi:hypothetical protein